MSKDKRIDLTKFEGLTTPWDFYAKYLHIESAKVAVKLIAELKKCYEIIDIYQSTGEDFNTQLAFHEKGLCEYLKHPCGPCEGDEGYYDDPLELSPELQAFYERGPSPRRTTESKNDKRTEHMKSMTCITCDEDIFNLDGTPVAGNWGCVCCGMTVHVQEGCGENNDGEVACNFCIQEGHYVQEYVSENEIIVRSTCQGWDEVPEGFEARQHHQVGGPFYDEEGVPNPYESS